MQLNHFISVYANQLVSESDWLQSILRFSSYNLSALDEALLKYT